MGELDPWHLLVFVGRSNLGIIGKWACHLPLANAADEKMIFFADFSVFHRPAIALRARLFYNLSLPPHWLTLCVLDRHSTYR